MWVPLGCHTNFTSYLRPSEFWQLSLDGMLWHSILDCYGWAKFCLSFCLQFGPSQRSTAELLSDVGVPLTSMFLWPWWVLCTLGPSTGHNYLEGLLAAHSICPFHFLELFTTILSFWHWPLPFHVSRTMLGEGNGNPLQWSCLENPREGGAWWASIYGVSQSWTRLKWLSSRTMLVMS